MLEGPRSRDASPLGRHWRPSNGILPRDPAGFSVATSKAARPMSARQSAQSPLSASAHDVRQRPSSAHPSSSVGAGRIKAAIATESLGGHTVASFAHQTLSAAIKDASAVISMQRTPAVEDFVTWPSAADALGGTPRSSGRPPRMPREDSPGHHAHFPAYLITSTASSTAVFSMHRMGTDEGSVPASVDGSQEEDEDQLPVTPSGSRHLRALQSARWASIGRMSTVSTSLSPPT